jgi:small subunit ribosomal protein S18
VRERSGAGNGAEARPPTIERTNMAKIFKHRTDVPYFDYKDFKTLQRYVNVYGQIETRKKTGLIESQQRRLATAIKRSRHIALLPFVANN